MTAYAVEGDSTNLRVCLSCVEAIVAGLGATPDADTSVTVTRLTGDAIGAEACEWCGRNWRDCW